MNRTIRIRIISLFILICMMISPIAFAFEELAKGSKGNAVVELQNRLNELGYSVGTADGDFGGKTEKAIMQYQQDNGLEVTGVLDEITYGVLFQDKTENVNTKDVFYLHTFLRQILDKFNFLFFYCVI